MRLRLLTLLFALPLIGAEPAGYKYWSAAELKGFDKLLALKIAKTTAPGELRGPSIEGGVRQKLSAGDVVHIPAKTAHQLLLDQGAKMTYFVMKVKE